MSPHRPARENPFASVHLLKVPFLGTGNEFEQLCQRFEESGWRGALVGPKGHGKTTLLQAMARHYQQQGLSVRMIRLSESRKNLPPGELAALNKTLTPKSLFCLDGAEQLNWWRWHRLLSRLPRGTGCLITSHRAGRLPTLWQAETSPELLERILQHLPVSPDWYEASTLHALVEKHAGNLRNCLFELYDAWSEGRTMRDRQQV